MFQLWKDNNKTACVQKQTEQVLVISKRIFNYCNTDFSLEISSEVQKVHKRTFTYKLTTKCNFQMPTLFYFCSTIMEWNAQDCGISNTVKDTSVLPSKINQMKVSQETGSEANIGFECALLPSYLEMCPSKAAFSSFQTQSEDLD